MRVKHLTPRVQPSVIITTLRKESTELSIKLSMDALKKAVVLYLKQQDPELNLDGVVIEVDVQDTIDDEGVSPYATGVTITRIIENTAGPQTKEIK